MKNFSERERAQVDAEFERRRRTIMLRMFVVAVAIVAFAAVFATSVALRLATFANLHVDFAQALRTIGQALSLPS
jgi:hypothetical protein